MDTIAKIATTAAIAAGTAIVAPVAYILGESGDIKNVNVKNIMAVYGIKKDK